MGFSYVADEAGRSQLIVADEPDYIVPLQIAPRALEEQLSQGKWLVVGMSVWSAHDTQAGRRAIKLVKRFGGRIRLGLRPVNDSEENATWVPDYQSGKQTEIIVAERCGTREVTIRQKSDASPIWVTVADGVVVRISQGRLEDAEILAILSELCDTAA